MYTHVSTFSLQAVLIRYTSYNHDFPQSSMIQLYVSVTVILLDSLVSIMITNLIVFDYRCHLQTNKCNNFYNLDNYCNFEEATQTVVYCD